jgi:hypothetical protein
MIKQLTNTLKLARVEVVKLLSDYLWTVAGPAHWIGPPGLQSIDGFAGS